MKVYCTRPNCQNPVNLFNSLTEADLQPKRQQFCSACTMPLIIGGQYLPVEKLGDGLNEVTFLAVDLYTKTKRQCVIKQFCPNPKLVSSQIGEIKDRFRQEAQALEALCGHSRIPSLYCYLDLSVPAVLASPSKQSKQLDHLFYLVWEYVEGQTLAQELSQTDRFSETEVIAVLRNLLALLLFIHEHQVIHQAIDPAHIVRDLKGQMSLISFGGIKRMIAETSPSNSKGTEAFSFASPEQRAKKLIRPASDLYSLGVTALCLLGGYESLKEMYDPRTGRWNWQSQIQVSDRLGSVLNRLLEPKLEQRFQSAAEVLTALPQEVFSTRSVNSKPDAATVEVLDLPQGAASIGNLYNEPRVIDREIRSIENLEISDLFESSAQSAPNGSQVNPTLEPDSTPKLNSRSRSRSRLEGKAPSNFQEDSATAKEEQSLIQLVCQAAILGSGGWLLAIALISFLGTTLTPGFWVLILGGLIFSVFAKTQSLFEKIRFLMIALVSVGAVFFLFPHFLSIRNLFQTLLLAMVAGLIAFVLVMSFQVLEKLINGND